MTVSELRDQILKRSDNVSEFDADNAERQNRIVEYIKEVWEQTWVDFQLWWTMQTEEGLTVNPDGVGVPNSDFHSIPLYGSVVISATGRVLTYEPPNIVRPLQSAGAPALGEPSCYSIYGSSGSPDFTPLIQTPTLSGAVDIDVHYKMKPPQVDPYGNDENLKMMPEAYHRKVLLPGVRALDDESKGKAGWEHWQMQYERAVRQMLRDQIRGGDQVRQLSSLFGG